tara:strand:- start:440 stop:1618 length:1179 start_codon:yes stop_codon:yes gene_type:complete
VLFQALDSKKECYALFCDGDLYHYPNSLQLTHTWAPSIHLRGLDIEYAKIWANGSSLQDVCPDELSGRWLEASSRGAAFLQSFKEAKVDLNDVCFYDLVPRKFLLEYFGIKNDICEWVFNHFKKPENHDFIVEVYGMLSGIKNRKLHIRSDNLDFINPSVRNTFRKIKHSNPYIEYNPWGTLTGRLTTSPGSFPILTLNRELRNVLVPNNDMFVELDYNSSELRTLLGLLGEEQPESDIHTWIGENVFNSKYDREEVKKRVFSWLYNPKAQNKKLNSHLRREDVLKKYYDGDRIYTPFGRKIEAPEEKAVNYLVQSTASDLFLTSATKIDKMLRNRKSFISFCIHDSLVIDLCKEDKHMLEEIMAVFSDTKFGNFKSNLSAGKSFGDMRKIL